MTNTETINTMKGKILMMALVLATFLALAATAKPAQASTYCNSSASAPSVLNIDGQRLIQFPGRITCDATVSGADMYVFGQWREVNTTSWTRISIASVDRTFTNDSSRYALSPRLNCTRDGEGRKFEFRTVNYSPWVQALNGTWNPLSTRYSSAVTIYC